ncbi:TPA: choloylglycine hydrolase family protein [Burkholderia aenigmatica]|uniref:choloylglycine hydrolase family protein n=1 Tax=Burkholderia sp. AU45251 TaxID=3059204 RepID=UPI002653A0AC|nr:choloylglycine hydrolase family protein [Burkholderia sp. AU45251]HDR9480883.1 choloylglycine hydrolase family protein [Burkholderia aenigmatica]MDN7514504.1 choloylglycine hydrolase family protein [Burkholderia sp. AU45251]HDR9517594.1 choloylglycine hydrolase family protein [Burkholderia aenigmatica]HDR9594461.1 choloylglycine hydrolase family protein [Burkholderia aenigmatica]HDR9605334.1 choloylglycine hydrolase family protein [Burkholderia aenigmatica]
MCTSFVIRTVDEHVVYGRTMEFAPDLGSVPVVVEAGKTLNASEPLGKQGLSWTTKYKAIGMNGLQMRILVDGINEKGLAGGILYFPGFAAYPALTPENTARALAPWDFLTWALTSFDNVSDVKQALGGIVIADIPHPAFDGAPPVHYTLHDASGASLVVEPVHGELRVHDNPLGVMTNSPPFDWHRTNLHNYLNLSRVTPASRTLSLSRDAKHVKLESYGQGYGMLGLPGDITPASRFVRAVGYVTSVENPHGGADAIRLAEHIVNTFDIPKGWIKEEVDHDTPVYEYTQWISIADLEARKYYFRTYDDTVMRVIDLATSKVSTVESSTRVELTVI